jgi:hypothetical protein
MIARNAAPLPPHSTSTNLRSWIWNHSRCRTIGLPKESARAGTRHNPINLPMPRWSTNNCHYTTNISSRTRNRWPAICLNTTRIRAPSRCSATRRSRPRVTHTSPMWADTTAAHCDQSNLFLLHGGMSSGRYFKHIWLLSITPIPPT